MPVAFAADTILEARLVHATQWKDVLGEIMANGQNRDGPPLSHELRKKTIVPALAPGSGPPQRSGPWTGCVFHSLGITPGTPAAAAPPIGGVITGY